MRSSREPDGIGSEIVETWYREHQVELVRLATLATGDRDAGQDVVQELFARLHRRPPRLDDPDRPLGYLRSAVLNSSRSHRRSRQRRDKATRRLAVVSGHRSGEDVTDHATVERAADVSALRPAVLAAVADLPHRQREVVLLRYWLDLSESEIAETLGISPGTVKSSAHRALATLAPALEELR